MGCVDTPFWRRNGRLGGDEVRKNRELFEGAGTTLPPDPSLSSSPVGRGGVGVGCGSRLERCGPGGGVSCGAKPGPSGTSLFSAKAGRMTDSIKAPKPSRHLRSPGRCGWGSWHPALCPLSTSYQLGTGIPQAVLSPTCPAWGGRCISGAVPLSPGMGKRWLLFSCGRPATFV